jgi:hypothetical protein
VRLRLVDPERRGPHVMREMRESRLIRGENLELRRRTERVAETESIPFFCKCRRAHCHARVALSVTAFDAMWAEWRLAKEHVPSAPPPFLDLPYPASIRVGPPHSLERD